MRILFVNGFRFPDYMNDMVYHGLIDSKYEVYETAYPSYMLSSHPNPNSLYGKGFSIFARLNHKVNYESESIIIEKISDKFYDYIIYGSISRDRKYIDEVTKYYPKERVIFIDGEDRVTWVRGLEDKGLYFKRECINAKLIPITFGIPESQLIKETPKKDKLMATIVPGNKSTYIFNDEESYYKDYSQSYYGITTKKAGWDCMRHYEILANKCIPYFPDLESCPSLTLFYFPKEIIEETNMYARENKVPSNYNQINDELFKYTKEHLTTKKLVQRIFR